MNTALEVLVWVLAAAVGVPLLLWLVVAAIAAFVVMKD